MDRILLTGATGFVGKQILKQLENKGHRVTIVVKPNWENRISIRVHPRQKLLRSMICFLKNLVGGKKS